MERVQIALEKARHSRSVRLGGTEPGRPLALDRPTGEFSLDRIRKAPASPAALDRHRIGAVTENGPIGETFRMLRTHVLNRLSVIGGQSLAVTSPYNRDGKTTVAIGLAVAIAKQIERSAVLVDADLRQPSIARYLGIKVTHELGEVLTGNCTLMDCMVRPGIGDLVVLPQRRSMAQSSELLASQRMSALVDELHQLFPDRIIIYDCPPVLEADDPLVLRKLVNRFLLVIREGGTTQSALERAAELIGEEAYLGSVLNNCVWQAKSVSSEY